MTDAPAGGSPATSAVSSIIHTPGVPAASSSHGEDTLQSPFAWARPPQTIVSGSASTVISPAGGVVSGAVADAVTR